MSTSDTSAASLTDTTKPPQNSVHPKKISEHIVKILLHIFTFSWGALLRPRSCLGNPGLECAVLAVHARAAQLLIIRTQNESSSVLPAESNALLDQDLKLFHINIQSYKGDLESANWSESKNTFRIFLYFSDLCNCAVYIISPYGVNKNCANKANEREYNLFPSIHSRKMRNCQFTAGSRAFGDSKNRRWWKRQRF